MGGSSGAFNKLGTKLYIPNDGLNTISVIDHATSAVVGSIPVPAGYMPSLSVGGNGNIYVPIDSTVYIIDPNTDTIIKSVPINCPDPTSLGFISFPRGRDYYYVPCAQDGLIHKIRIADDSLIATLDVSSLSPKISIVDEGLDPAKLYVSGIFGTATGDKIVVVNSSNGSLLSTISLTNHSIATSITPDGQYIYAPTQGTLFDTTNIDVVSTASDSLVGQIDTSSLGIAGVLAWLPGEEVETEVGFTVTIPTLAETGEERISLMTFSALMLAAAGVVLALRAIVIRQLTIR